MSRPGWIARAALPCALAAACGEFSGEAGPGGDGLAAGDLGAGDLATGQAEQAAIVCGVGPTVLGVDVSSYQGVIDWAAARAGGVEYAFIRAGDGAAYTDPLFATNWSAAATAGVLRGAYQFFRPAQDPIAQADRLLAQLAGSPGDLPPVIDVEDAGGLDPAAVEASVRAWIDRVRPAIGREPIVYTGFYFWRDMVGAADLTASPLWHAQYSTAACPTIAPPWVGWAFWQHTATGRVAGIAGDVDVDRWNGTREDLAAFAAGPRACGVIGPGGGVIDDGDPCFTGGGPPQYLRRVTGTGVGVGDDLIWTYATAAASEANFGHWELFLAEAGRYYLEVSTPAPYAASARARYAIRAAGARRTLALDQTAASGWQRLAELDFAAGGGQWVHLGDNTGDAASAQVQLAIDAIRLVRVPSGEEAPVPDNVGPDAPLDDGDGGGAGCRAGGPAGPGGALGLGLALLAARRRRRRRRRARPRATRSGTPR